MLFLLDPFDGVDAEAGEFLCLLEIGLADFLPPLLDCVDGRVLDDDN